MLVLEFSLLVVIGCCKVSEKLHAFPALLGRNYILGKETGNETNTLVSSFQSWQSEGLSLWIEGEKSGTVTGEQTELGRVREWNQSARR